MGAAVAGVGVKGEAGVAVVGEGWKIMGMVGVQVRRGSLGPPGDRAPPVLASVLTFCNHNIQTGAKKSETAWVKQVTSL